jgi:hypothetical protein
MVDEFGSWKPWARNSTGALAGNNAIARNDFLIIPLDHVLPLKTFNSDHNVPKTKPLFSDQVMVRLPYFMEQNSTIRY